LVIHRQEYISFFNRQRGKSAIGINAVDYNSLRIGFALQTHDSLSRRLGNNRERLIQQDDYEERKFHKKTFKGNMV
jgi:hypothetical protein